MSTEDCTDMIDNDGDGLIDYDDPDCGETKCDDGIDNNSNGLIDCDDFNCQTYWPICIHLLALAAIAPQSTCQGSLVFQPNTSIVECDQPGGLFKHDYFNYPLAMNGTGRNIMGRALTGDHRSHIEDTMLNCAEFEITNFGHHKVLKVGNNEVVPEKAYRMLQKFHIQAEDAAFLSTVHVEAVYLLVKGMGFGGGNSTVYPAFSAWNETNTTCFIFPNSGQLFDDSCGHVPSSYVTNEYGWSLVNITQIFMCQVMAHEEPSLNLVWVQDSSETISQVWHSSESPYPPQIISYYS